jgi:hypothetical protein
LVLIALQSKDEKVISAWQMTLPFNLNHLKAIVCEGGDLSKISATIEFPFFLIS